MLFKVMELRNLVLAPNIAGLIKLSGKQWATSVFEENENCEGKLGGKPEERKSKPPVQI
jgi:hypothetical protein